MAAEMNVLTNVLILRSIFKNMSARQLNKCCKVCKLWNDEGQREKASRHQIHWNTFVAAAAEQDHDMTESAKNLKIRLETFVENSPIQPVTAIVFCSESLSTELDNMSRCDTLPKTKKARRIFEGDHLAVCDALPDSCQVHVTSTDGIIGTDAALKTLEYEEYEQGVSIILFGSHLDLKMHVFFCTHDECETMVKFWTEDTKEIPDCFHPFIKEEVKMFNVFCPTYGVDKEILYGLFRMFDFPLVAGGQVSERIHRQTNSKPNCSFCSDSTISGVAVSGQGVQVASVVIRSSVKTEKEVDALVKELAEHNFPLEHSLGFMFSCIGRGSHIHGGKRNVESKIFRKYCPNTPLFGFFANGEIGCSHPSPDPLYVSGGEPSKFGGEESSSCSYDDSESLKVSRATLKRQIAERKRKDREFKLKHPPKVVHAYSTVFCLISMQKNR